MNKRIAWFMAAVALQAVILAAVPARQVYTRVAGRTIRIRTAPVDPYNLLSGYHVILSYEIARPGDWSQAEQQFKPGQTVYVVLKPGDDDIWAAESVHAKRPEAVDADAIVIRGKAQGWRGIVYGIESYYIPEEARGEIERDLRENGREAVVEIKVDSFGNAALMRILIEDRVYAY